MWAQQRPGYSLVSKCQVFWLQGCGFIGWELSAGLEACRRQLKAVRHTLTFEERVGAGLVRAEAEQPRQRGHVSQRQAASVCCVCWMCRWGEHRMSRLYHRRKSLVSKGTGTLWKFWNVSKSIWILAQLEDFEEEYMIRVVFEKATMCLSVYKSKLWWTGEEWWCTNLMEW